MCGITGIYAFNEVGRFFTINTHKSNEQLKHRGPDFGKLFTDYYVGLGHRRLSIIDLSSVAHQPMYDESGRYVIVFNGEIYNFKELRTDLEAKGCSFHTHSDTEVLLQSYIQYGEKCLEKFHGFFAFAIYDKEENKLFIGRDRYGIKPLLYFEDEDKMMFASEMRALLAYNLEPELDPVSVYQYLQLNYVPAPHTIFKGVKKLMPGSYLVVQDKKVTEHKWYTPAINISEGKSYSNYEEAKINLLMHLEEAVKERMVSDVPLGAFLSGGIDSSTVVALASKYTDKLNTYSVGFKNEPLFDETKYAELVAKKYNTNHTVFNLHTDDFFDHMFEILDQYAEPFADSSALPFYILSKKTRQQVTVTLSGDGADEVFAGYHKYMGELKAREKGMAASVLQQFLPVLDKLPKSRNTYWGNQFRRMHRFASSLDLAADERYWFLCSWATEAQVTNMLHPEFLEQIDMDEYHRRKSALIGDIKGKDFNEVLLNDVNMLLPNDMLHKVDSMSMLNSLEVRVPFLDHRLVEFAFNLPAEFKIKGNMKKRILQDTVRPLLPPELYKRPKKGFDVPLAKGYKNELKNWVNDACLNKDMVAEQKIFRTEFTENLKSTIANTMNFDQNQVWGVLAFQHWWKKWRNKVEKAE
ncbi:asparagine synthase (glutamine-hydrolyzing) [Chondrinema litorale]|uniref:asparagine synthase (glutamine-hydrolyzing) n=1 Tax=Chondrinema litorale TaxID=2994555 RepID=UPI0025430001|nr:asparagine synthase (glutamine-hydrolyzing) [Chondrinema litorale]UZR94291.1 asparagine synthase (glutamine-hydrolyzing) [Chondrinema litorale]